MGSNDFASLHEGTSRTDNVKVFVTESGVATTTLIKMIELS